MATTGNGASKGNVLVTGAGGYIGSTLVPMLLQQNYRVRAIDRYFFGREMLPEHDHLEIVREDTRMLKPEHLKGIDYVIDLVAISNDPSGELFQAETYAINHRSRATTGRTGCNQSWIDLPKRAVAPTRRCSRPTAF